MQTTLQICCNLEQTVALQTIGIFSNFLQRVAPLYIRQDGSVGPLRDYSKDDLIRFKVKAGSPSNLPLRVQASSINKACTYHGGWEDK